MNNAVYSNALAKENPTGLKYFLPNQQVTNLVDENLK